MRQERVTTSCTCQDPAHMMEFVLHESLVEEPALYLSVQLNPQHGFLRRCLIALGYVLGRRSRYRSGHWDSGSLSPGDAYALWMLLQRCREADARWEAHDSRPAGMAGVRDTATTGTVGVA